MVDTACLRPTGGEAPIRAQCEAVGAEPFDRPTRQVFRGIDPTALVASQAQTEMPAGIAGTNVALRFEKLPRATPLLMSLEQLDELDAHIHCRERKIDFNAIEKYGIDMVNVGKGHMGIKLDQFDTQPQHAPKSTSREVDIFVTNDGVRQSGVVVKSDVVRHRNLSDRHAFSKSDRKKFDA